MLRMQASLLRRGCARMLGARALQATERKVRARFTS